MIVTVLSIALFLGTIPILILSLTLSAQLAMAAIRPARPMDRNGDEALVRCVIVVPAHDEAAGIEQTIAALQGQSVPGMRIVVVADNCTDATATLAQATGAEVLERHDPERRGKGYALDHAVRFLAKGVAPSVVIFIDADCYLGPHALSLLASAVLDRGGPVQACYLMEPSPGADVRERLRGFAFAVRNLVRPSGGQHLGFPSPVTGSGMAFPWPVISTLPLASGHIVEDLKLGIDSALAGYPVSFCAQARVLSTFPQTQAGVAVQTARWEHGHALLMRSYGPRLLMTAWRDRRPDLAKLALDLLVPPIGLLLSAGLVCLLASLVLLGLGGRMGWLVVGMLPMTLLLLSLLVTWLRYGRQFLAGRELLVIVSHVLKTIGRLPLLLSKGEHHWIRSDRRDKEQS